MTTEADYTLYGSPTRDLGSPTETRSSFVEGPPWEHLFQDGVPPQVSIKFLFFPWWFFADHSGRLQIGRKTLIWCRQPLSGLENHDC